MKKLLITLFVAFYLNINAQIITTVAGNGTTGYVGDGGQATNARLWFPYDIAIDGVGNLFIADNYNLRVRKVNTSGIITTVAGNGTYGFSGDGGQATAAEMSYVTGIAIDASGNIYFTDNDNYRLRKVNTSGIISTVAGNGMLGDSGDGGQAITAKLSSLSALAFDAAGNLYIGEGARIRMVNTSGIITTIAGNGTPGFSGDGGQATAAELLGIGGMAFDPHGNLYVADEQNNRVRKINTSGIITTIAGDGTVGTTFPCTICYGGDGGQATAAKLNNPEGITVDAVGNIYITDTENNRIRQINTSGIITTMAGNGTLGFNGDGGAATAAEFYYPVGMCFDAAGNLYIVDSQNNRIRKVTNVATMGISQYSNLTSQISIYPNPSTGIFTIETNISEKQNMQIFDVNGKVVLSQTILGKTNIDASTLPAGVYNISLSSSQGITNKRLVIAK